MDGCRIAAATLAVALLLAACASITESDRTTALAEFRSENLQWREGRLARLTEPYGWLSLVALEFIDDGIHRIGRARDNDLVVPDGPAVWGEIRVDDGEAEFVAEPGAAVTIDGRAGRRAMLAVAGEPTEVRVQAGRVQVHLVNPGGRLAVRVRDPQSPTRRDFAGLDYFDLDPAWRVEAAFEYHPEGRTIPIANVAGQLIDQPNLGAAKFTVDGREHRLEAVADEDSERLFFIFADRTSGGETYGLGRFLYADKPEGGRVVLDFNQSYNPPCAFTQYTTCPLPPPENRLDLRVEAGEKSYAGRPGLSPEDVP